MKKNAKEDPLNRLSPREGEVLALVVEGCTSKEIAAALGVKPSSVQTYRSRIMAKLETRSVADLVRLAIRRGLIRA
jgi:DNA-binding CsgD family transcriptional regulator